MGEIKALIIRYTDIVIEQPRKHNWKKKEMKDSFKSSASVFIFKLLKDRKLTNFPRVATAGSCAGELGEGRGGTPN